MIYTLMPPMVNWKLKAAFSSDLFYTFFIFPLIFMRFEETNQ